MSSRNFSKFLQSSSLFVPLEQIFGWLHDPCLELSVEGHDFLYHRIGGKIANIFDNLIMLEVNFFFFKEIDKYLEEGQSKSVGGRMDKRQPFLFFTFVVQNWERSTSRLYIVTLII